MVIGEKLWEGNGKTQVMTVQDVNADGATVEFTWSGDIKGVGKAKGIDGTVTFTGRKLAPISGPGKGSTKGKEYFSPKGEWWPSRALDMVILNGKTSKVLKFGVS